MEKIPKWSVTANLRPLVGGCGGGQTGFPNLWLNISLGATSDYTKKKKSCLPQAGRAYLKPLHASGAQDDKGRALTHFWRAFCSAIKLECFICWRLFPRMTDGAKTEGAFVCVRVQISAHIYFWCVLLFSLTLCNLKVVRVTLTHELFYCM